MSRRRTGRARLAEALDTQSAEPLAFRPQLGTRSELSAQRPGEHRGLPGGHGEHPTNAPAIGAATGTHEYHHCELPLYFNGCKGVHDARPEVAGGVQSRTARTAEAGDRTPDRNPTPMALAPGAPANDGPCGITSAASARTRVPRNSVAKPLARLPRGVDGGERAEHVL